MKGKGILKSKWPYFLLVGALSGASYAGLVSFKTEPKEKERVNVFLSSYGLDKEALLSFWNQRRSSSILRINLSFYFSTSSDLGTLFTNQKGSADTFLLPSSFLKSLDQSMLSRDFIPLAKNEGGYSIDGVSYGELAYSSEAKSGVFSDWIVYEKAESPKDDYYIFYRRGSLHSTSLQRGLDDEAYRLWREE